MLGTTVSSTAVLMSTSSATSGVEISGKPKPSVPWATPATMTMPTMIAMTGGVNSCSKGKASAASASRPDGLQQRPELRFGKRLADEIALHLVAAELAQDFRLPFRFDALGHDREAQRVGERDDGRDGISVSDRPRATMNERSILREWTGSLAR